MRIAGAVNPPGRVVPGTVGSRWTPPTRHSLLRTKERLETARTGLELLERRRERLVFLLKGLVVAWQAQEARLADAVEHAEETRTRALEREGAITLQAAAMAREDHAELLLLTRKFQGLSMPLILSRGITKRLDERGYGILGTSATIDETAAAHEAVLELVVRQAELQLALRVLVLEIRRTSVRVHGLRYRVVPELEETERSIEFHLAEREREERMVQRFFKRKRERR